MSKMTNDPRFKELFAKLSPEQQAKIEEGLKDPRQMHLEVIRASYQMLGAETWLAVTATVSVTLGYSTTHFEKPETFMEYLDKALNEKELMLLATTLLLISEASCNETAGKS